MISSTCFGQTFAHLQERKTEVFFITCGIVSCCCGRQGFGARQRGTTCTVWRKLLDLSLVLLKMGKSLPETSWADHWRSIKLLLLHLVGFYITLPTASSFSSSFVSYNFGSHGVWSVRTMNYVTSYTSNKPPFSLVPGTISPGIQRLTSKNIFYPACHQ